MKTDLIYRKRGMAWRSTSGFRKANPIGSEYNKLCSMIIVERERERERERFNVSLANSSATVSTILLEIKY